jgi:uncharacterized membrane protein
MTLEGLDRRALLGGLVFVVLGILFLLEDLGVIDLKAVFVLPIVLILVGAAVLVGSLMDTGRGPRPEEPPGGRI